jgi:hypothetical protein
MIAFEPKLSIRFQHAKSVAERVQWRLANDKTGSGKEAIMAEIIPLIEETGFSYEEILAAPTLEAAKNARKKAA